ncbi:polysaccharide deacetylase family protein [Lacrimispora sp. NSJ-141]|uniref:Polysaccharide deacetylase family protein n=1 Tax=Lientehia hominis TaxID=2897778 RepID=A0AAP2W9K3_9FIRM|nr:polysaccharide deacetylase family protein [Lientehia hominis]MCD2491844.1 polysaccharide deacetylase family protein [Lientehia hominis]
MRQNTGNCGGRLVLTFDDGPDRRYTGTLLDLLKKEQIPAAFFVVGNHAAKEPELVQRMEAEGHIVGSHSIEHRNALISTYNYMKRDFEACRMIHMELLGRPPRYFRPPWGIRNMFTRKFVKGQGMRMVLWDVMAQDWRADASTVGIAKKLRERVSDGAIICLHDAGEDTGGAAGAPLKTIKALELAIPDLKASGYHFISLDEYFAGAAL